MIVGYARVLTSDQSLDGQRDALKEAEAGCLYADTMTGAVRHRPELDHFLDRVGRGLGLLAHGKPRDWVGNLVGVVGGAWDDQSWSFCPGPERCVRSGPGRLTTQTNGGRPDHGAPPLSVHDT